MNCKTVLPLLSAYVDHELTGVETLAVREHLRACPGCSREVGQIQAMKTTLSALHSVVPAGDLESKLRHSVFGRRSDRAQKYAIGALIAATSMIAALVAIQVAERPQAQPMAVKKDSSHALDAAANRAYLADSDPISGSVPVVTVSYAGDH